MSWSCAADLCKKNPQSRAFEREFDLSDYATNQELTLGRVFRCGLAVNNSVLRASRQAEENANEATQSFPPLCHCRESSSGYATRLPFRTGIATRLVLRHYAERNCRGLSERNEGSYGNALLSVGPFGLWPNGTVVFKPGGAGFQTKEGALGMKFGWTRGIRGKLNVTGRRIDADAPRSGLKRAL